MSLEYQKRQYEYRECAKTFRQNLPALLRPRNISHTRLLGDSHPNRSIRACTLSTRLSGRLPAPRRRDKYLLFKIPAPVSRAGPKINRSCRGVGRRWRERRREGSVERGVDYKPKATERWFTARPTGYGGGGAVYAQGRWSVQQQQQQPRRSTVRVVYARRGWGCTGHCCINRFGELGVATPEGTAHVRIDYTTPSPRTTSHRLSLCHSVPPSLSLSLFLSRSLVLSHLEPLLDSLLGGGFDSSCCTTHISLSFFLSCSFSKPLLPSVSFSFSLSCYSFMSPSFLLRLLTLGFTLGPLSRTRRMLFSPRGAHGARRSVIFKPFAL